MRSGSGLPGTPAGESMACVTALSFVVYFYVPRPYSFRLCVIYRKQNLNAVAVKLKRFIYHLYSDTRRLLFVLRAVPGFLRHDSGRNAASPLRHSSVSPHLE